MSNKMITAAWDVPLPAHARLVLIALADSASEDEGVCWISNRTIREKSCAGKSTVGYILAAFERLGIAVRETRFESRKNGAQTSSIKRIRIPVFTGSPQEIAAAKAHFAAEYDAAYAWARSPKDTPTTQSGTLEPSSFPSCDPSSSSSLPPQQIEEDEEGVISSEIVALDPYFEIQEEGMDGLSRNAIIAGVERLISQNAGDGTRYRKTLIREILSGGGRTLGNIRRPRQGPRFGANREEPILPPGVSIFDLIKQWTGDQGVQDDF